MALLLVDKAVLLPCSEEISIGTGLELESFEQVTGSDFIPVKIVAFVVDTEPPPPLLSSSGMSRSAYS
jgi:hypothetical protein